MLLAFGGRARGTTFTTFDHPLAVHSTAVRGISGNNLVGIYTDSSHRLHGFLYNGSAFTPIDHPLAPFPGTSVTGVSGNNVVGYFLDASADVHGFVFSGSTFTALDDPRAVGSSYLSGIEGKNIVGGYWGGAGGFLYNGSTFTKLPAPLRTANGISGSNIVGSYGSTPSHGYLYNGSTYKTIDYPLAGVKGTYAQAISGNKIVGYYLDSSSKSHGFLYDGSAYTTLDFPGATSTNAIGISGNTVVGAYSDAAGNHGFIAQIPEPSSLLLLSVGAIGLATVARQSGPFGARRLLYRRGTSKRDVQTGIGL